MDNPQITTRSGADPYLQEIGRAPLLTAEAEVFLAKQIERGREAARRLEGWKRDGSISTMGHDELRRFERSIQVGHEARTAFIESNLRLVVSIAKRYNYRKVALSDLIQEGNLGLIKAVERFDYHKGFRFSTYAAWWIRQAITRASMDQARTVRVPVHVVEAFNYLAKVQRELTQELGEEPSTTQLALRAELPVERVRAIQRSCQDSISLEQPIGSERTSTLLDVIEDDHAEQPIDAVAQVLLREVVQNALNALSLREKQVLQLRFGIEDGCLRTCEEVGKIFGVSRARIEHIESKALGKLRQTAASLSLREYVGTIAFNTERHTPRRESSIWT